MICKTYNKENRDDFSSLFLFSVSHCAKSCLHSSAQLRGCCIAVFIAHDLILFTIKILHKIYMSQCGKKNYCYKRYAYTNILRADICIVTEHFRRVHAKHSGNRNNRRDDGVQRNDPLRPAFLFDFSENAFDIAGANPCCHFCFLRKAPPVDLSFHRMIKIQRFEVSFQMRKQIFFAGICKLAHRFVL